MRETISRSASRVPILGDIPLVGALFRSSKSERLKSELLLFLTPQVVRTSSESADLTASEASRLPDIPKSLREATSEAEEEPAGLPFDWDEFTSEEPPLSEPEAEMAPSVPDAVQPDIERPDASSDEPLSPRDVSPEIEPGSAAAPAPDDAPPPVATT